MRRLVLTAALLAALTSPSAASRSLTRPPPLADLTPTRSEPLMPDRWERVFFPSPPCACADCCDCGPGPCVCGDEAPAAPLVNVP